MKYRILAFNLIFLLSQQAILCRAQNIDHARIKVNGIKAHAEVVEGTRIVNGIVVGFVDVLPEVVWKVIVSNNKYKHFMPYTKESIIIPLDCVEDVLNINHINAENIVKFISEKCNKNENSSVFKNRIIYFFSQLDFPFPISDRWYIIKILRDESNIDKSIFFDSWDLVIGNQVINRGFWKIEPYNRNETKITYNLQIDTGGILPKFIIRKGVELSLPGIIRSVMEQAYKIEKREMQ